MLLVCTRCIVEHALNGKVLLSRDLDSVDDKVKDYYVEKGTKIVHDTDQDTTDLEKCMDLVNSLGYPMLQVSAFPAPPSTLPFLISFPTSRS